MNLFNSIITSIAVVTAFWAVAFFQSDIAHAIQTQEITHKLQTALKKEKENKAQTPQITNTSKLNSIHLSGVSAHIELADIQLLWQKFSQDDKNHKYLKNQPEKVYVLYTSISKNYKQANVLIGYDVSELSKFYQGTLISMHNNSLLMPVGKYSEQQLSDAWKKIDYNAKLDYILEEHHLDDAGKSTSTKIYISYK